MEMSTLRLPHRSRSAGFTLIELMVAVAIVAILTAIAYPSYRNYVLRGQVMDATNGLSALQANMERYFQDNRTYASVGAFVSPCLTAAPIGSFTFSCSAGPTATTYTLQASGTGPALGFTYTVDESGNKATTASAPGWVNCASSWETKAGQC